MSSTTDTTPKASADTTPKASTAAPPSISPSDPDQTPTQTLAPSTLTSNASISIREYIYHLPYPLPTSTPIPYSLGLPSQNPLHLPAHPFEPTSTLVLTSPHRTFVDLRFLRPHTPTDAELPNPGPSTRLDWAFAGSSASTLIPPGAPDAHGTFPTTRASWSHWLDSRAPPGSGHAPPADEGVVFMLPDGRALEHGHADDGSGVVRSHEEMWRDDDILSTNAEGTKVCAVLRCCDDAAGVRGVVVRVGQWVQGVLWGAVEGLTCERWEFCGERTVGEREEWKRSARVGVGFLPCAVLMRTSVLVLGGKVQYGGVEWRVEELWEWV